MSTSFVKSKMNVLCFWVWARLRHERDCTASMLRGSRPRPWCGSRAYCSRYEPVRDDQETMGFCWNISGRKPFNNASVTFLAVNLVLSRERHSGPVVFRDSRPISPGP